MEEVGEALTVGRQAIVHEIQFVPPTEHCVHGVKSADCEHCI